MSPSAHWHSLSALPRLLGTHVHRNTPVSADGTRDGTPATGTRTGASPGFSLGVPAAARSGSRAAPVSPLSARLCSHTETCVYIKRAVDAAWVCRSPSKESRNSFLRACRALRERVPRPVLRRLTRPVLRFHVRARGEPFDHVCSLSRFGSEVPCPSPAWT
jgi:hypothetical protein